MKRVAITGWHIIQEVPVTFVFLCWALFRGQHFVLSALRTLNEHGPLHFYALLDTMGYTSPSPDLDNSRIGLVAYTRIAWYLNVLLAGAKEGRLYAKYDEGHSGCQHVTFTITLAGQSLLERRT
jgi:hypothetical protein